MCLWEARAGDSLRTQRTALLERAVRWGLYPNQAHPVPVSTRIPESVRSTLEFVYISPLGQEGQMVFSQELHLAQETSGVCSQPLGGNLEAFWSVLVERSALLCLGVLGHARHSNDVIEGGDLGAHGVQSP